MLRMCKNVKNLDQLVMLLFLFSLLFSFQKDDEMTDNNQIYQGNVL